MGHLGIRIINIALFTTSCFFTASIVNHVADSMLAPDYVSAFQPVAQSEPQKPGRQQRNAILDRNLFGAKLDASEAQKEPEPEPVEVVEEAEPTKLPIELLGTMAGNPASLSSAVINNTRTKKHQVLRLGDVVDGFERVTVTDIEPGRVLLKNRDLIEELLLDKNDGKKNPKVASRRSSSDALQRMRDRKSRRTRKSRRDSSASLATPTPAAPASTEEADAEEKRLRQVQEAVQKDLIRDLEPAMNEDGSIEGVLVGGIDADSLLARAGLSPNDVIRSLNGIDIDSAGAAARGLREISKCKPMTISVDGPGGTRDLVVTQALLSELNCTN